jgi:hypothetical protein
MSWSRVAAIPEVRCWQCERDMLVSQLAEGRPCPMMRAAAGWP